MNNNGRMSIATLAELYYEGNMSRQHKWRLFRKELEKKFGHHLSLKKRIERKGWYRSKRLPPAMVEIIMERLGEP